MRKILDSKGIFLMLMLLGICSVWSCSDNSDETPSGTYVKPGIYKTEITLYTEEGEISDTRGLDSEKGEFTSVYPYDYIYIHSADTNENGIHRCIKIPLVEVEECDGCKGIHLEVEVFDNEQGYTIANSNGEKITLANDEKIYFSTIPTPFWEAKVEGATPVSHSDIFVESEANQELLRSIDTYDKAALVNLITEYRLIEMARYCTGFRVYFMFTNVPKDGSSMNVIDEAGWKDVLGVTPENFYIKLYLGPNFCHRFDMLNTRVVNVDKGGFYTTNDQYYHPLDNVTYVYMGGSSYGWYQGFGYQTADNHYLLSPLNTNIAASDFSIYAFVKYNSEANITDPNYLYSDEGARFFQAVIPDITLTPNRIHYVVMAFDVHDLKKIMDSGGTSASSLTRTPWSPIKRIELKPIKVICE